MTARHFDPNDPRLTAYVLDELEGEDLAAMQRRLEECAETRAAVDDIRKTVDELTAQLAGEPSPALTASQRAAIEAPAEIAAASSPAAKPTTGRRRLVAWITVSVTAASVAFLALAIPPLQNARDELQIQAMRMGVSQPDAAPTARVDGNEDANGNGVIDGEVTSSWIPLFGTPGNKPIRQNVDGPPATMMVNDPVQMKPNSGISESVSSGPVTGPVTKEPEMSRVEVSTKRSVDQRLPEISFSQQESKESNPIRMPDSYSTKPTGDVSGEVGALVNGRHFKNTSENKPRGGQRSDQLSTLQRSERRIAGRVFERDAPNRGVTLKWHSDEVSGFALGLGTETYATIVENRFVSPVDEPLSTFAIDVDTASYSNVRRFLNDGRWPPADAVRIEEMINYFRYDYPEPADGRPFSVNLHVTACPWNVEHRLVCIGLKGKDFDHEQRPPSNLVFLIDVSGSMRDSNKLPLVKASLEQLVSQMTEDDRIAIVTYAGTAGLQLDSTSGQQKELILSAIGGLNAGGSTNGEGGIKLAYETAVRHFYKGGTNRVILCTDGDFNVGVSDDDALVELITEKAKSGVFLSIFGFGRGNLKDAKLEKLANKGNGHYGYVDNHREAHKVFVEDLTGTLYTIAKDVKIQVEFNPARVGAYRLIGYENRAMTARDFNDDKKDAGEIGAGHRVTALYEIVSPDQLAKEPNVDPLKYQRPKKPRPAAPAAGQLGDELLTVKLRYKKPDGEKSVRLEYPLNDTHKAKAELSREFEWASAVAAFGMILRGSEFRGQAGFDLVLELVQGSRGPDEAGHRREFIDLVNKAKALGGSHD